MQSIGPYRLDAELGRGAMGIVFRGFDPAIGRPVAIKIIQISEFANAEERAELKLRFSREATAAGRLSHPNIVTIFQLGEQNGIQFLVLELIEGRSLEQMLSVGQPPDPSTVIAILSQVADALDFAHSQGVVHRDVKPANILIRDDGKVKITDFGIARIAQQTVTRTGFTMGTLGYMAPEQIMAEKVTGKADQYSLAVMAYQMLCGRMPFVADTDAGVMFKIVSSDPSPAHIINPLLQPTFSAILSRAMAKNSNERFASCSEFIGQFPSVNGTKTDFLASIAASGTHVTTPLTTSAKTIAPVEAPIDVSDSRLARLCGPLLAISGIILVCYILGHLLFNLRIYSQLNSTGLLRIGNSTVRWILRVIVGASAATYGAISLVGRKYMRRVKLTSQLPLWTIIIGAMFTCFHVLHLEIGAILPIREVGPNMLDDRYNILSGFHNIIVSTLYILTTPFLGQFVYAGLSDFLSFIGIGNYKLRTRVSLSAAVLIAFGYISFPLAVLTGVLF